MKKSRKILLHEDCNKSKMIQLEKLYTIYKKYLKACVKELISIKRTFFTLRDISSNIFPISSELSVNIIQCCRRHACFIVNSWALSKYKTTLKNKITQLKRKGNITEEHVKNLYVIGKYSLDHTSKIAGKFPNLIDLYQSWLFDESIVGKTPEISECIEMRTSERTAVINDDVRTELSNWWLSISCLEKGKRIKIPLKKNPYIKGKEQVCKSFFIKKDMLGRWYVQVTEKIEYILPRISQKPKLVGVDVGLNVLAAVSNGVLLGRRAKERFDKKHSKIKSIRANRQRQGLTENSKRLKKREYKLSELIKTETGRVANKLVKDYPDTIFILEDLNLQGCREQKRFAYNKLQNNLKTKVNTIRVNAAYSSQICSSCKYLNKLNRNGEDFCCKSCGRKGHADVNAAVNLLERFGNVQVKGRISEVRRYFQKQYVIFRNIIESSGNNLQQSSEASNLMLTGSFIVKENKRQKPKGIQAKLN